MASTKKLRESYGLSQQEMALFIGSSRFQVAHHETKDRPIAFSNEEVLRRLLLLFQEFRIRIFRMHG
jgi:DNA-binding XRE family transcriptional regulator